MRKQPQKREIRKIAVYMALFAVFALAVILIGSHISRYVSGAKVQSQVEEMFYGQSRSASIVTDTSTAESTDEQDRRPDSQREQAAPEAAGNSQSVTDGDSSEISSEASLENHESSEPKMPPLIYTEDEDIPEYDFTKLLAINPDVKGWLHIPAAEIDNPIVQAEDNDYYLHRNIYGEEEYEGTFFFDHRCEWGVDRNCVIYGHAMLDGSMMYKLRNLLDQEVADENPAFLYITPEHVYECQIFSVYRTTIYDDYLWFEFFGDEDYLNYLQMMKDKSEVVFPDCGITAQDSILTISTCNRQLINDGTGRMAVYAKIVEIR